MAKLVLTLNRSNAEGPLADRVKRLTRRGPPTTLNPVLQAIHFLRGVDSRASLVLPQFYLFLASNNRDDRQCCIIEGYPGLVFKDAIRFSSINSVSLACRKAFDHKATGLTGASFARSSHDTLEKVAQYWAESSSRPILDALSALHLLKLIFSECAQSDSVLLGAAAPLCRRIGLLKQYANRSAAHLSMEPYEFSPLDCAHVVAALTIIGEIIRSFDRSSDQPTYYDAVDEASSSAARKLFPDLADFRLFHDMKIEVQARLCWQWGIDGGRQMILEQLPYAVGWWEEPATA